ncbi:constitutive coactivator of peroxisome proliferator-activated receptor gamma isoform X2 [Ascaphus truei]
MGIKGLQGFVQNSCPNVCNMVNLRQLASRHTSSYPGCTPTIVVDAMGCLRSWYTPTAWVHGGQWKEYLYSLQAFIAAFRAAGIHLVFIFDGVIEQKKRAEWVKRRLQNNHEVSKIFQFIKANRQQPGRNMFFIPSGLSTFTRFALKSLGQKVICSRVEGDYEVAAYGLQHNCLGILGEDSDYLIFNTVPYFSINKLCLQSLATRMYSRDNLCKALGLRLADLPLLACLLGNDIVPAHMVEGFQRKCTATYRPHTADHNRRTADHNRRAHVIWAVATFISRIPLSQQSVSEVEKMLPQLFERTLLLKGIESYVLPQQESPWLSPGTELGAAHAKAMETSVCPDSEIVQIAVDQHAQGDNSMICNVLCLGETESSNTLEDESDLKIPGQALIYRPARQHIYAVLLGTGTGSPDTCPVVKEWFVYPGNRLQEPDIVQAVPLSIPGGTPSVRSLWLDEGPGVQGKRFYICMACFHAEGFTEQLRGLDPSLAAVCCLLIYLALQVDSLSLTDLEAFLAQALCLRGKSSGQLKSLQLPCVDPRAVHLAFLFLRGLNTLMEANSACGFPLKMMDLMPWNTFDGKLFHQKYLQCHVGRPVEEILEGNESLIALFRMLKSLICDACAAKNRIVQARECGSEYVPGRPGSSFATENRSQCTPPYGHESRRNEWHDDPRQPTHHPGRPGPSFPRGQRSHFTPPCEHGGRGSELHGAPEQVMTQDTQSPAFPMEYRSRRRGQRGRGGYQPSYR